MEHRDVEPVRARSAWIVKEKVRMGLHRFLNCISYGQSGLKKNIQSCVFHLEDALRYVEGLPDSPYKKELRDVMEHLIDYAKDGDVYGVLTWTSYTYNELFRKVFDKGSNSIANNSGVRFLFLSDYEELAKEALLFPFNLSTYVTSDIKVDYELYFDHPIHKPVGVVFLRVDAGDVPVEFLEKLGEELSEQISAKLADHIMDSSYAAYKSTGEMEVYFECPGYKCRAVRNVCIEVAKKLAESALSNPVVKAVFQDCERLVSQ